MDKIDSEIKKLEKELEDAKKKKIEEEQNKPITAKDLAALMAKFNEQQPYKEPPVPDKEPIEEKTVEQGEIYKKLPAKTCAAEVLNHLKLMKIYVIGSIAALFVTLLINQLLGITITMGAMIVAIIPAGIYLKRIVDHINKLKSKYRL